MHNAIATFQHPSSISIIDINNKFSCATRAALNGEVTMESAIMIKAM